MTGIEYITLGTEEIRIVTRDGFRTKDLAKRVGSHSTVSPRLLQAIIARSEYGDEDMDEYNFSEYDSLREESKEWSYEENRYDSLEDVQQLEREVDQALLSSDDEYDFQTGTSELCFVEHIWKKK